MGVPGVLVGSIVSWLPSPPMGFGALPFGGDCGGSIRTDGGGLMGFGLSGGGLASRPCPVVCGTWRAAGLLAGGLPSSWGTGGVLRTGLVSGMGGGLGVGEGFRGGGAGTAGVVGVADGGGESLGLLMFSKRALSDETGFKDVPSGPSPSCDSMIASEWRKA